MANHSKTFAEYQNSMECNGYAYFDKEAFKNSPDEVCYIPENGNELEDTYSKNDLIAEVEDWKEKNELDIDTTIVVQQMFNALEWSHPSTWLEDYLETI